MNIIERGRGFVQSLRELASRSVRDWRQCPHCGGTITCKHGSYVRRPWTFGGRQEVRVQRHLCHGCGRTYSEGSASLVQGSWYGREVHRCAIDHWQHVGSSLRRTAEWVRSYVGRQERWWLWRPLEERGEKRCHLNASTVHRWLDAAGRAAQESVRGQLEGIPYCPNLGTDGLWARLRGRAKRVVLMLVDSVSGLKWPPVVEAGEESRRSWQRLFQRAKEAGLNLEAIGAVTSDGAHGLVGYLRETLAWVHHQRCVWHLWRQLGRELACQAGNAAAGLAGDAAKRVGQQVQKELVALIRGVLDAQSYEEGEASLAALREHTHGARIWKSLNQQFDATLVHLLDRHRGLTRVTPEWCWRDFRQRLSHGRNHGSNQRLERAALVWAIYHNFTPTQWRSERKRRYRRPGQSSFEVAGAPPGQISYLDALCV